MFRARLALQSSPGRKQVRRNLTADVFPASLQTSQSLSPFDRSCIPPLGKEAKSWWHQGTSASAENLSIVIPKYKLLLSSRKICLLHFLLGRWKSTYALHGVCSKTMSSAREEISPVN
ncbi:hypothetical protein AVEN_72241-1 [Araneus ventricosus]|uniref:Uncharacterized protein n=1 Tax=Araneus ventricosus TaxID=182803 RepID=A0A4Y2GQX2_ARAVE|nr:hypothetical protein AVEN_72241-1 [Araneus ventricosus]